MAISFIKTYSVGVVYLLLTSTFQMDGFEWVFFMLGETLFVVYVYSEMVTCEISPRHFAMVTWQNIQRVLVCGFLLRHKRGQR